MGITLKEIIGNEDIKKQLAVAFRASELKNTALPHLLFTGAAGCGKTTMAHAVANMRACTFIDVSPGMLKTPETAARLFSKLSAEGYSESGEIVGTLRPTVLFIDEAHNLPKKSQELLGLAMENGTHTFTSGRGNRKENLTMWLPKFTAICATTDEGKLLKMFRDRFKISYVFRAYPHAAASDIVRLHAQKLGVNITEPAIDSIALRGRGIPRILVRYLENAADCAHVLGEETITKEITDEMFEMAGINSDGFTKEDIRILKLLYKNADLGPMGIDNIAITLGVSASTILEVNEPYLIQRGLISRTGKGRALTELGHSYLSKLGIAATAKNEIPRILSRTKSA